MRSYLVGLAVVVDGLRNPLGGANWRQRGWVLGQGARAAQQSQESLNTYVQLGLVKIRRTDIKQV
jgi:hypothetical protein